MSRFTLIPWVVLVGLATSAAAGSTAQAGPAHGVPAPTVDNYGVCSYEPLPASSDRGHLTPGGCAATPDSSTAWSVRPAVP